MKHPIAVSLRIVVLCGGPAIGWSQTAVSLLPTTPMVEVVASPVGATVQATGTGFGSLGFGHVAWASQTSQFGVSHTKNGSSFSITTNVGLLLACSAADQGHRAS